jgi:hypothetical protein
MVSDHEAVQHDRRSEARIPARIESRLRLMLDSSASHDDVTVLDISHGGAAAAGVEGLVAGVVVMLDIPLVGWRSVEVMWIDGNRAGCRFLQPLTETELRAVIARSPLIQENFPGMIEELAALSSTVQNWGKMV